MRRLKRIGLTSRRFILVASLLTTTTVAGAAIADADRQLLKAILADDAVAFEQAVGMGADANAIVGKWEDGWAMCAATVPGKESYLRRLLAIGGNPDLTNPRDNAVETPAICSMVNRNPAAFDILIAAGADPNRIACSACPLPSQTSLYRAALELRNFDIALRLLELVAISPQDMLYTKELVERSTTLQGPNVRALATRMEAYGMPIERSR